MAKTTKCFLIGLVLIFTILDVSHRASAALDCSRYGGIATIRAIEYGRCNGEVACEFSCLRLGPNIRSRGGGCYTKSPGGQSVCGCCITV